MSSQLEKLGINTSNRVLFIYPHPDDETYFNAGLLQKLIAQDTYVFVLCLTYGGASTLAFGLSNNEDLATVRKKEFESVMEKLGVKHYKIETMPDNKLTENKETLNQRIQDEIESVQPTHVITFEPSGVYGHPDNIIVNEIVTKIAQKYSLKLIYSTVPDGYKASASSLQMAKDPKSVRPLSPNFRLYLSYKEYFTKLSCLKLYKSQFGGKQNLGQVIKAAIELKNEHYVV